MKKKHVALLLSSVLALSMPLTVSAAETAPTSADVETEGTVNYANTTVYEVTLPTSSCFNFVMDPQGILSATDTAKTTYTEEMYPAGTAGYIVATEGTGAYINNSSSVPIKLTVDAYVESDNAGAASSVQLMDIPQYELINSGIDNNVMLTLDITNDELNVSTFVDQTSIKTETVVPYVMAIMQNGKPDTDTDPNAKGTQISFALNKAEYEFTDNAGTYVYTKKSGETGDSVGMRLSGFVNTNADWSEFVKETDPEKIIVKTVFTFDKLSTDYEYSALNGVAHGVLDDRAPEYVAGSIGYDEDGNLTGAPAVGSMEYAVGQGALEIPFDYGTGTKEVTVTDVSIGETPASIAPADYKVNNYVISLKSTEANVKAAMDAADPEGTVVPIAITTSDGVTAAVNVTVYGVAQ